MSQYLIEEIKWQIKPKALATSPKEAGGLIVQKSGLLHLVNCNNISNSPTNHFIIHPKEKEKAERIGKIVAFWHSHSVGDEGFSLADKIIAEALKLNCVLYEVINDTFSEYSPCGLEIPYIGRPFFNGVLDCTALVIDYYNRELNIPLCYPYYHPLLKVNPENWTKLLENKKNNMFLRDMWISQGFVEIDKKELKLHDIILIQPKEYKSPCRNCIYLGNQYILHQPLDDLSEICNYSRYWAQNSKHFLRHKIMF